MALDNLLDMGSLSFFLPADTGTINPVLEAAVKGQHVYLLYSAPQHYLKSKERLAYVHCGRTNGLFDTLTAQRRGGNAIEGSSVVDRLGRVMPAGIETADREGFLRHPYILGVCYENGAHAFGIIYHDAILQRTFKNGASRGPRIIRLHMSVSDGMRRNGLGTELLGEYIKLMAGKDYDGVACQFGNDEEHTGCKQFFEKSGFKVVLEQDGHSYTATFMFDNTQKQKENKAARQDNK